MGTNTDIVKLSDSSKCIKCDSIDMGIVQRVYDFLKKL